MPQNDEYPLYDIGIDDKKMNYKDNSDYIYNHYVKIYYNNKFTFNEHNKKIIGK